MATKMTTTKSVPVAHAGRSEQYEHVFLRPRITEKATALSEKNVYTFDIAPNTTKSEIVKALRALYKVAPKKVRVLAIPDKKVTVRGKIGYKGGGKKAVIYLNEGDTITL